MKTELTARHLELLEDEYLLSDELFDELHTLQKEYAKRLNLECAEIVETGELIEFYEVKRNNDEYLSLYKRNDDFIIEWKVLIGSEVIINYTIPVCTPEIFFDNMKLFLEEDHIPSKDAKYDLSFLNKNKICNI